MKDASGRATDRCTRLADDLANPLTINHGSRDRVVKPPLAKNAMEHPGLPMNHGSVGSSGLGNSACDPSNCLKMRALYCCGQTRRTYKGARRTRWLSVTSAAMTTTRA